MKLLGNSVSVPVIEVLAKAIIDTGVFDVTETESSTYQLINEITNCQVIA
jgi:hypothetical protein